MLTAHLNTIHFNFVSFPLSLFLFFSPSFYLDIFRLWASGDLALVVAQLSACVLLPEASDLDGRSRVSGNKDRRCESSIEL